MNLRQKELRELIISLVTHGLEWLNNKPVNEDYYNQAEVILRMVFDAVKDTKEGLLGQEFAFKVDKASKVVDIYFDSIPDDARKFKV